MEVWNTIGRAEEFGASIKEAALHWDKVIERKNNIIGKFVGGKKPYLEKLGVDLVMGNAEFTSADTIRVGDKEFSAERFLIGTGSKTSLLPIEGMEYAVTNKELFELKELPKSLVIIGGGVISLEFAHIFAHAGVKVTILQRSGLLLKTQDEETSQVIREVSEKYGIHVKTNTKVNRMEKVNGELIVHVNENGTPQKICSETVLAAAGRIPDLDGLGLEAAGVKYSKKGIEVNEYLQTSAEKVYAAGDSIGGLMLTPIAAYEAKVAVRNAFRGHRQKVDYTVVPQTVFTLPPVAGVGLTEEAAKENGIEYEVNRVRLSHNGVAIILGEEEGYMKILSEKGAGRIIGAHMVGVHADELIHEIAIAMKGKLTLRDLSEMIQVHPTISEAFIELAREGVSLG